LGRHATLFAGGRVLLACSLLYVQCTIKVNGKMLRRKIFPRRRRSNAKLCIQKRLKCGHRHQEVINRRVTAFHYLRLLLCGGNTASCL